MTARNLLWLIAAILLLNGWPNEALGLLIVVCLVIMPQPRPHR